MALKPGAEERQFSLRLGYEASAMALAGLVFVWVLLHDAGHDLARVSPGGGMALATGLTLPAVMATDPGRRIRPGVLLALVLVPVSAFLVCVLTPMHFSQARDLGTWLYSVSLGIAATGFACTSRRRVLLALLLSMVVFLEFFESFRPWHYEGNPSAEMIGTFYWHNQFGVFCAAGAIIGAALTLEGPYWARLVGWVTTPFAVSGVVLSRSRFSELLTGAAWVGLVASWSWTRRSWKPLRIWALLTVLSVAVLVLLVSPLLFPSHAATGGGSRTIIGSVGKVQLSSIGSDVATRTVWWRTAIVDFAHRPLAGQGFGSFAATVLLHQHFGLASPFVHNGVLQALAEGGLVFGLPVAVGFTAIVLDSAYSIRPRQGRGMPESIAIGGALALLVMALHSLQDFDWVYPSLPATLLVSFALTGRGLRELPNAVEDEPYRLDRRHGWLAAAPTIALGFLIWPLATYWSAGRATERAAQLATHGRMALAAGEVADAGSGPFRDGEPALWLLQQESRRVADGQPFDASRSVLAVAIARSASLASVDPEAAVARAWVRLGLGQREALQDMASLARDDGSHLPEIITNLALMLDRSGYRSQATDLLMQAIRARATPSYPVSDAVFAMVAALDVIDGAKNPVVECAAYETVRAFPSTARRRYPGIGRDADPAACTS